MISLLNGFIRGTQSEPEDPGTVRTRQQREALVRSGNAGRDSIRSGSRYVLELERNTAFGSELEGSVTMKLVIARGRRRRYHRGYWDRHRHYHRGYWEWY
jgi:hypothetical protein